MIYNDEKHYYTLLSTLIRYVLILNFFLPMMVDFLGEVIIALGYKYNTPIFFMHTTKKTLNIPVLLFNQKCYSTMRLIVKDDYIYMVSRWSRYWLLTIGHRGHNLFLHHIPNQSIIPPRRSTFNISHDKVTQDLV
jgi:hypothetical protein